MEWKNRRNSLGFEIVLAIPLFLWIKGILTLYYSIFYDEPIQ